VIRVSSVLAPKVGPEPRQGSQRVLATLVDLRAGHAPSATRRWRAHLKLQFVSLVRHSRDELNRFADEGVRVFLAAYGNE
jgi:hypothetical protein